MPTDAVDAKRILILISSLSGGGAERNAARLASLWAEQGRHVTIVTLAAKRSKEYSIHPAVERYSLELGMNSGSLLSAIRANFARIRGGRQAILRHRSHVAVAFMESSNVLLALSSIGLNVRTIGCERTYPPRSTINGIWRVLRDNVYGMLDVIVTQTETTAQWIRENTRAQNVVVIPNVVDWPLQAGDQVRDPVPWLKGQRIVIAAGRLHPLKGFDHLITAFSCISTAHPNWCLVILGEGPQRAALETQISSLGLEGRVFLAGYRNDIADWFSKAAIFVLTSDYEGFPNVMLEAMASGLPAVSFDCNAGPRDIIRDGLDGILVSPGDEAALSTAIASLMDDEARRKEMGLAATSVRERFSPARIMALWDKTLSS